MRLIDMEALIDDCKKYLNKLNPSRDGKECSRMHWLIGILSNAPTIDPERKWIPCSERLPEGEELVLVTDDSGGIKTVDVDRCGQYENSNERFWYYTQNVVAWMPLPEPYKERREE